MENKLKTIAYDYLFNYFGGDTYDGKVIVGASVQLAIKAYKNGKEIKFSEEPKHYKMYWYDIFSVSFCKKNAFIVEKNLIMDNLFRFVYGFDEIKAEVIGYSLDYSSSLSEEQEINMPKEFCDLPCSTPMEVTEEVFKQFIMSHKEDFDITDNKNAQVPSFSFI